jgi:hypothetical protein
MYRVYDMMCVGKWKRSEAVDEWICNAKKNAHPRPKRQQHGIWACSTELGVALPLDLIHSIHLTQLSQWHLSENNWSTSLEASSDEMRIILMGPPGAGMRDPKFLVSFLRRLTCD